jgi:hypothetical protein
MNKGYIIPVILIILLIILAGFFVFAPIQKSTIDSVTVTPPATTTPVIEREIIPIIDIATTTQQDDVEVEDVSTSTENTETI